MTPCRIYICDDSPEYRLLLRMVLADEGAVIVGEGADGQECLDGVAATEPSLVLLDLNMPNLGGLEALPRPGLAMTFNVDGFGDRPNKLSKYTAFTAQTRGKPFADGYKLFYHEDTNLMAPANVMRMRPRPDLVVYE